MAGLVDQKIAKGTANFLHEPAMTQAQCTQALDYGAALVEKIHRQTGCNIVGFGEMGIGNSSAAALLTHLTTSFPLRQCVGRGTGLTEMEWREKLKILDRALHHHQDHLAAAQSPLDWLCLFGGFEIVQLCGAMLKAASLGMAIVVDGYIATAALLVAWKLNQQILPYSIFAHQSEEEAHKHVLAFLNATPLLQLRMRLGEGTGAALALPLLKAAVGFLNEMASFDSASVSNRLDKYF
jgi:nicotinate-nucleotide--dimethylbenzimidazole phosphoribosyltransferase